MECLFRNPINSIAGAMFTSFLEKRSPGPNLLSLFADFYNSFFGTVSLGRQWAPNLNSISSSVFWKNSFFRQYYLVESGNFRGFLCGHPSGNLRFKMEGKRF